MALLSLTGPRLPPARGKATHLVVLCHGYGSDGNDLIALAPHFQRRLPTVAFAAPNAPERCAGAGYQWFPLSRIDPRELQKGVAAAAPLLNAFLDAELERLGLSSERLVLAGFSQGTMLALHVGLARGVCAIAGFSGLLAAPPAPGVIPPVLLTHGDADQVIPPEAMFAAAAMLGRAGGAVQWHLAAGIGHGIDAGTLDLAGNFLGLAMRGALAPRGEIACALG